MYFLLLLISSTLALSANWAFNYFGLSCFEQIVFHLKVPLEGTNTQFIKDWFRLCLLRAFLISIILFIIFTMSNYVTILSLCASIIFLLYAIARVGIFSYCLHLFQTSDIYEKYYIDGKNVDIEFPKQKRNLIYIYVESLETTFTSKENGGNYKDDLIKEISTLAKQHINFSHTDKLGGAHIISGTGWTTAGIVAQSAGLPLLVPLNTPRFKDNKPFLPGAYALGDILHKEGYNQEYLIGSDALFGGRKFFFDTHKEYRIFDLNTAYEEHKIDEHYKVFWGYEDEKLFSFAKDEVMKLASLDKPFNFTMLTVDTHHPYGYKDKQYQETYSERLSNIISENSKKVGAFVNWIQTQPFYENTTIVICGDHLSMAAEYINKTYDKQYERTTFNTFINAPIKATNTTHRNFTSFDLFPTTLASLGVRIATNRLGLGTNLFSNEKTLAESIGLKQLEKQLLKQSKYYKNHILK